MISDTEEAPDPQESARITTKNRILSRKRVAIIVLGDIGRSPRMRYHALSFSQEGYYVHMIGTGGSPLPPSISSNPSIWVDFMPESPTILQKIPRLLAYPLKIAWQMLFLAWAFVWMLCRHQFMPHFILLQNPPAIPTLTICYLFSKVLFADFVVDWHNYGYTLMGLSSMGGADNPLVRVAKGVENYFGARADSHLCVTRAMKQDLKERLGVEATTLYDRPPEIFAPLLDGDREAFLGKMAKDYPSLKGLADNKGPELGKGRPGILISSTSWTEDEDFGILLAALEEYETVSRDEPQFYPKLIVFITGKGPQKAYYQRRIESISFKNVEINCPWLEHADYPKLLACADLGISLHYSSSGLDLPMKVVDMFGCGLPVCAVNFNCLSELVKNGENGYIFNDSTELATQIQAWFRISSKPNPNHAKFRENIKKFRALRWHENWKLNALPIFK